MNPINLFPHDSSPRNPDFLAKSIESKFPDVFSRHRGVRLIVGDTPGPNSVKMCTNDYLCIAEDPRIINAEVQMLQEQGHGDAISRVFTHQRKDVHRSFEKRMARFMKAEDSLLTMSGYCANVGLIQGISQPGMVVHIDMMAHASLWEGVASARMTPRPFRHNSIDHLERQVRQYGPGLILVDALYSTTGTICPLVDIVKVSESYGCALVVDETHSFGAQGPRGSGLVCAMGLAHRVHFRTVGLSKAMASRGGVVVGSARNMECLRYEAFPMMFSTSVLAHDTAGYDAALSIIETEQWRRDQLRINHAYLVLGLAELGYNVSNSHAQIIGLEAGTEESVLKLRQSLEKNGVFGSVFCAPATPKNRALVRLTVNSGLRLDQLDHVLRVCHDIRDEVGMWNWPATHRKKNVQVTVAQAA